jgi:hypothetical protein
MTAEATMAALHPAAVRRTAPNISEQRSHGADG